MLDYLSNRDSRKCEKASQNIKIKAVVKKKVSENFGRYNGIWKE